MLLGASAECCRAVHAMLRVVQESSLRPALNRTPVSSRAVPTSLSPLLLGASAECCCDLQGNGDAGGPYFWRRPARRSRIWQRGTLPELVEMPGQRLRGVHFLASALWTLLRM